MSDNIEIPEGIGEKLRLRIIQEAISWALSI